MSALYWHFLSIPSIRPITRHGCPVWRFLVTASGLRHISCHTDKNRYSLSSPPFNNACAVICSAPHELPEGSGSSANRRHSIGDSYGNQASAQTVASKRSGTPPRSLHPFLKHYSVFTHHPFLDLACKSSYEQGTPTRQHVIMTRCAPVAPPSRVRRPACVPS